MHDLITAKRLELLPGDGKILRNADSSNCRRMTEDLDSKDPEEYLGKASGSDTGRGFSGAGTFEDISSVYLLELE
jgi:hypothetical protein